MEPALRQRRFSETNSVDIELVNLIAELEASTAPSSSTIMSSSPRGYAEMSTPMASSGRLLRIHSGDDNQDDQGTTTTIHTSYPRPISSDRLELTISPPEIVLQKHGHAAKRPHPTTAIYVPSWRDTLRGYMHGVSGVYLEIINTALSLYEPAFYDAASLQVIEITAAFYFLFHYVLHLVTEDDVRAFVFSFNGLIDLTTLPSLVLFFLGNRAARELTLFRVFRVFRALRVLRLHNLIRSRKHGYNYEWTVFVFSLSAIIFVAAGVFHALEDYPARDRQLHFHDSLYYILVTLSTIGYGDITPSRTISEFFVMGLIILVVTTVPEQIARLHALHVDSHAYDGAYVGHRAGRGHVIVAGHVTFDSLADFLAEFYHPSRGVVYLDVVVLSDEPPSAAVTRLLANVVYAGKATYLRGSLVHDVDRARTKLETAEAVFVLADTDTRCAETQDASTLLQALSVRNHTDSTGCHVRMYLQMVSDVHDELSYIVGANQTIHATRIKADILSRGVVCPGSCALILNLLQSVDHAKLRKKVPHPSPWMQEYMEGMGQQIYTVHFSDAMDGHRYEDVARRFFEGFDVVLLAVYRREMRDDQPHVVLSPFGNAIREGDIGFILTAAADVVHAIQHGYRSIVENEEVDIPSPRSDSARRLPFISKSSLLQRASPTKPPTFRPPPSPPLAAESPPKPTDAQPLTSVESRLRQVTKKAISTHDHVVVCGSPRHSLHLIPHLRSMYSTPPTLVFLVDQLPPPASFETEGSLPDDVIFVRGVASQCADLLRVSIQHARAVLLFPTDAPSPAALDDYGVVTSLLCLETACNHAAVDRRRTHAVVDLRDEIHSPRPPKRPLFPVELMKRRRLSSSASSSGMEEATVDMPPLLPATVAVLRRGTNIKFCRPRDATFANDAFPYLAPAYAAGRVFVDSRLDLALCQAFYNPYLTEILHALTGGDRRTNDDTTTRRSTAVLLQVDVPVEYANRPFGYLFAAMLRQQKLVLGLYRHPRPELGNVVPFVLTAPSSTVVVHPCDRLFVVSESI
ncbi:Aste57867_11057 [Aphanomyces stellatus]|uniref:Aste57867_11057 protein n=1 Tax=Aphanomyces stellatus TaxID=120398 RepID=A0A485KSI6_9STRA|nr:hypothetical protein As57867_011015 [Aphanomyces stellatus]VFT87925.1 Aste57867_11057 [Aphanomyces stellatus]